MSTFSRGAVVKHLKSVINLDLARAHLIGEPDFKLSRTVRFR